MSKGDKSLKKKKKKILNSSVNIILLNLTITEMKCTYRSPEGY